ncbi:MAG: energy-coupling factor ABC transporter ATP-binding protein [Defluviitaleaceae bacterium]|nr:energy-coupling factor ABC transporter ATP-binding protein [Defluviitaleaceae bacterium]
MTDNNFVLTISDLRFKYADRYRRSSFELVVDEFAPKPSVCTAVMGENGSGKTTLGKLVAGILRPASGCIFYNGVDISDLKLGEIGRQVGYLFQEPSRQIFASKPLDEIAFPLELRGIDKEEARTRAKKLLDEFELSHIINNTTFTLSRGEKQRLAIAAAMIVNPKYFVLDEPTTGLDKQRRKILAKTLKKMQENGMGILLISHDMEFVEAMEAEIRTMKGGRLLDANKS